MAKKFTVQTTIITIGGKLFISRWCFPKSFDFNPLIFFNRKSYSQLYTKHKITLRLRVSRERIFALTESRLTYESEKTWLDYGKAWRKTEINFLPCKARLCVYCEAETHIFIFIHTFVFPLIFRFYSLFSLSFSFFSHASWLFLIFSVHFELIQKIVVSMQESWKA